MTQDNGVAIVIPSYRVKRHIMKVLDRISDDAAKISVVNDKYSEPGQFVLDIAVTIGTPSCFTK